MFTQKAPTLGNQYDDDLALRRYLRQALPPEMLSEIELSLREMGELAGGALYRQQLGQAVSPAEAFSLSAKFLTWQSRLRTSNLCLP